VIQGLAEVEVAEELEAAVAEGLKAVAEGLKAVAEAHKGVAMVVKIEDLGSTVVDKALKVVIAVHKVKVEVMEAEAQGSTAARVQQFDSVARVQVTTPTILATTADKTVTTSTSAHFSSSTSRIFRMRPSPPSSWDFPPPGLLAADPPLAMMTTRGGTVDMRSFSTRMVEGQRRSSLSRRGEGQWECMTVLLLVER
jgi:hypothetical protein